MVKNAAHLFRENLKAACERRGITQRELAARSGVHYVYINRVFHGHAVPSLTIADKLATGAGSCLKKIFADSR